MSPVAFLGATADPDELRAVADAADAGAPDLAERLASLPRAVLTSKTLASPPGVIATRLREVAAFLERRQAGVPFGGPELAASIARLQAQNARMRSGHLRHARRPATSR